MSFLKNICVFLISFTLLLQVCSTVHAADGTWYYDSTKTDSDYWWNTGNWVNGHIPNGANRTVELQGWKDHQAFIEIYSSDPDITLGGIYFAGTTYFSFGNWGKFTLRRTSGKPFIYNTTSVSIGGSHSLLGTNGFVKKGAGTLQMYSQLGLSGNILIEQGELQSAEPDSWNDNLSITIDDNGLYSTSGNAADQFGGISGSGTLKLYCGSDASDSWIRVGANNASTEFSGLIEGAGSLGKTGTGTMTISGANTFTGRTWVEQGTLLLTNSKALGKSNVELSSGFDLNGLNHTFGGITGSTNFALAVNSVLTVGANNKDTTYSGVLSGSGASLEKIGNGTLTLTKDNTYTGGTVLKGGKLCVDEKSQINLANGKLTFDGGILRVEGEDFTSLGEDEMIWGENGGGFDIVDPMFNYFHLDKSLSGNGKLIKQGNAELILVGHNGSMTGDVHVQKGTLKLRYYRPGQSNYTSDQNRIGDTSLVNIDSGAKVQFDLGKPSERIGALSGAGVIDLGKDGELIVGDARNTEFSGIIMGDIEDEGDVSGKLIKVGSGRLTLSGYNGYNRGTELREGTLSIHKDRNLGFSEGDITFDGGILQITGTDMATTGKTITWTDNGGGFDIDEAGHTFTVDQAITGSGGVVKRGAGTLTLSVNNNHTGLTTVEGGVLRLTAYNSGTFEVNGGATLRAGINNSLGAQAEVNLATGAKLILEEGEDFGSLTGSGDVETEGYNFALVTDLDKTFAGDIHGGGRLFKRGDGILTLSGDHNSTGGMSVDTGMLRLRGNNGSMAGTILVKDGAILRAGCNDSLGVSTRVNVAAGGKFIMEDSECFGSLSGAGEVDIGTFELKVGEDNTDATFSGTLLGSRTLLKCGTGMWTLSGDNSFTSNATVMAGTLQLTGSNADLDATIMVRDGATLRAGYNDSLGVDTHVALDAGSTFILEGNEDFGSLSGAGNIETEGYYFAVGYDDTDMALSGRIRGTGDLYKRGTGTLTLSGDTSSYSGDVHVKGGTLTLAAETLGGSSLDVWADATLDGTGTIAADVTNLGTIAPGNSPGLLTIDGDYTQDATATLLIELSGLTRGDEYDALIVTGNLTLAGALNVVLLDGFETAVGDTFDILDFDTISGQFDTLILPSLATGLSWDTSNLYTTGEISTVPEPTTLALLLPFAGLAMLCRRFQRRKHLS